MFTQQVANALYQVLLIRSAFPKGRSIVEHHMCHLGKVGRSDSMAERSGPRTVHELIRSGVINPFSVHGYLSKLVDSIGAS
jgi:hypothetical protein